MQNNNRLILLPRKVFIIYIIVTLTLFFFGPIKYQHIGIIECIYVCGYMLVFLLLSYCAYSRGANKAGKKIKMCLRFGKKRIESMDLVKFSILYSVLLYGLLIVQNSSVHGRILFNTFNFFNTMAQSYTDIEYQMTLAGRLVCYTSIFKVLALIGCIYYWKDLKVLYKMLTACLVLEIVLNNIFFVGSQKQLVDLFIYVLVAFVANIIRDGFRITRKIKIMLAGIIVVAALVMGSTIAARVSMWETKYNAVGAGLPIGASLDTDNILYKVLPEFISLPLAFLSGYLSQGYRGLALCMSQPFVPTWGMGFSFKIMNDFAQWFNIPLSTIAVSYPIRMEQTYGIGAYSNWHSIFPWFASDVTFVGALFIVATFIYLWAKTWREVVDTGNLWSLLLFAQLTILVLYIPCNNKIFQTRESIVLTLLIYFGWRLFRGMPRMRSI